MTRFLAFLASLFLSGAAAAQTLPVYQTGLVTPGHAAAWSTNGVVRDAGGAAGSAILNSGYLTELGITNTGTPSCINDALIGAAGGYHQLCFGALALGGGLISYNAYGGATPLPLLLNINGSFLPIVGSVTGLPSVATTTILAATPSTFAPAVVRQDYSAGFGAPPVTYLASASPCVLGAGAGDGGSCIPAAGGGSWLMAPQTSYDIREWGLTSGPVHFYISKASGASDTNNPCVTSALPCSTINHAAAEVALFDVAGGNAEIDALPGGSNEWDESLFINQPLRGAANTANNPCEGCSGNNIMNGVLTFDGGGTEIWNGGPSVCVTLGVSNFATVQVANMANMEGTGVSCQSTEFAQENGQINNLGGNTFGPASADIFHVEETGSLIQFWDGYAINGDAPDLFGGSDGGEFLINRGVGTFNGARTYAETIFLRSAEIQFNVNPAFALAGGASVSARPFVIVANAVIETSGVTTPGFILGSGQPALEGSGARYHGPLLACIGGASGCGATVSPTGLGSSGTAVLTTGSDEYSGEVIMTAGSGASSSGQFQISFGVDLRSNGGVAAACSWSIIGIPSSNWATGAFVRPDWTGAVVGFPNVQAIFWGNSVTSLTAGDEYGFQYVCSGSF